MNYPPKKKQANIDWTLYKMERQTFIDSLFQSMRDSARQVRLLLGRPSSQATREQALRQVEMLQAAKEAQTAGR